MPQWLCKIWQFLANIIGKIVDLVLDVVNKVIKMVVEAVAGISEALFGGNFWVFAGLGVLAYLILTKEKGENNNVEQAYVKGYPYVL